MIPLLGSDTLDYSVSFRTHSAFVAYISSTFTGLNFFSTIFLLQKFFCLLIRFLIYFFVLSAFFSLLLSKFPLLFLNFVVFFLSFGDIFLFYQPLTIFEKKKTIVTVRLGSEYVSVIINLISTSNAQLYSKATKINEIFIGTPHFFLKLVQKLRNNKSSSFGGPL